MYSFKYTDQANSRASLILCKSGFGLTGVVSVYQTLGSYRLGLGLKENLCVFAG